MKRLLLAITLTAAAGPAAAQWQDISHDVTAFVRDGAVGCDTYDEIVQYQEFRRAGVRLMPAYCRQIGGRALIDTVIDRDRLAAQGLARVVLAPARAGSDPVTVYILADDFGFVRRPRR